MKIIKRVDEKNIEQAMEFLRRVMPTPAKKVFVRNGVLLLDDEHKMEGEVIGNISFRPFGSHALLKYFIVKKTVNRDIISSLFKELVKRAREKNLKALIALVIDPDAFQLFSDLGFYNSPDHKVLFEGYKLKDKDFSQVKFMVYDLEVERFKEIDKKEELLELYKEYFEYSEMLKDGRKFGGRMLVEHERDKIIERIKELENNE